MVKKMMKKWGVQSRWEFFVICLVFSIAGMMIVYERRPLFHVLGIDHMPLWFKILIYIPLVCPIYQMNLLIFGFLFGKFPFFWEKEKKLVRFLMQAITKRKAQSI